MRIALPLIASTSRNRRTLRETVTLWSSRRALAALSAEQLDDIGISRADATAEARRPVWDAPASWKC
ncbi:DUF1127 domain-containing protein [uncultured Sulfitobacter sp.]|uniref:DUF1127 domain-containing protein n=1 Tax=uncultured Sulfitobacter sp. TaxID=191468 RepID=UPI0026047D6F|nr:DUF1127 domain-containing protein [uncultured Sulfitobacter sp.]